MRAPDPPRLFRPGLPAGFIAGLILGLLLGWAFHGVVGLVVRLGFVLLLLIPLAILLWFFLVRGRGQTASDESGGVRVYTWRSGQGMRHSAVDSSPPPSRQRRDAPDAIDAEFEELKRQAEDEGTPR